MIDQRGSVDEACLPHRCPNVAWRHNIHSHVVCSFVDGECLLRTCKCTVRALCERVCTFEKAVIAPLLATYVTAPVWPMLPTRDERLMMLPSVLRRCGSAYLHRSEHERNSVRTTVAAHRMKCVLASGEHGDNVDVEELLEVGDAEAIDGLVRRVNALYTFRHTNLVYKQPSYGVIDQAVELAERLHGAIDEILDLGLICHIALDEENILAVLACELGMNLLALSLGPRRRKPEEIWIGMRTESRTQPESLRAGTHARYQALQLVM